MFYTNIWLKSIECQLWSYYIQAAASLMKAKEVLNITSSQWFLVKIGVAFCKINNSMLHALIYSNELPW